MKVFYLLVKILVLVILLFITANNIQDVEFTWSYQQSVHVPLIVLLFIFFVIGTIIGVLARSGKILKLNMQNSRLKKELRRMQATHEAEVTKVQTQNVLRLEEKTSSEAD